MKKLVKITESQLNRIVNKTINEQFEMKDATPRRDFKSNPRERQLKDVFGSYGEDVPPVVLRYMRKNPKAIIQKLYDIYGDKMFDYIKPEFPLDEATVSMDEAKQVTSTQYDLKNPDDVKKFNDDIDNVTDTSKINVGPNMAQITSESDDLLDEGMDYREALNKLSDISNKVGVSLSDLDEKTKDSFVYAIMKNINPENELAKTNFRRVRKGDSDIDSWDDVPMMK